MLACADMVFIAVGMGGGTGTGAAPVIAEIAKSQGALTVGIVTKPFTFEGRKRSGYAEQGIRELAKHVDSLIIIQNDKLLKVLPKNVKFNEAFGVANDVFKGKVKPPGSSQTSYSSSSSSSFKPKPKTNPFGG